VELAFFLEGTVRVASAGVRGALVVAALGCVTAGPASAGPGDPAMSTRDGAAARLVEAAVARTAQHVVYDGRYQPIAYPGGDVPDSVGVCTDLVIRAYRSALGIDLQRLVHEDMTAAFDAYPGDWGHVQPDPNIDHRRVPNLETFLRRAGAGLPATDDPTVYRAGDLVTWRLPGNLPHIGIVVDRHSSAGTPLVAHNIGRGPVVEDMLFAYPITAHFRYLPADGHEDDRDGAYPGGHDPTRVWDLDRWLTPAELATNRVIHATLSADTCDAENAFDPVVKEMITVHGPNAPRVLRRYVDGGGRCRYAAVCRGLLEYAHEALARGDVALAGSIGHDLYRSSAPHRLRLEALRLLCRGLDPAMSRKWIELIREGRQDARFAPALPELEAARALRIAELDDEGGGR